MRDAMMHNIFINVYNFFTILIALKFFTDINAQVLFPDN